MAEDSGCSLMVMKSLKLKKKKDAQERGWRKVYVCMDI